MKLTVIPNSIDHIEKYKKIGAKAFIFGLKGFSSGYICTGTIDQIIELTNRNPDIEIFIAMNKNIFNSELPELENTLKKLEKTKIKGVLFYDLAILNLKIKNNLSLDLVWNQTHMVTNYNSCNYYYEKGVKYGVLSGEITLEEIKEIKKKTAMQLFVTVMGYPIMSFSRRTLLNNYFLANHKKKDKDTYIIKNNNEDYIIEEEDNGDAIYYGKILNGSIVLKEMDVEYVILNEFGIEEELFAKTLSLYKKIIDEKKEHAIEEVDNLLGTYRGFFFQKTIYKVKKND